MEKYTGIERRFTQGVSPTGVERRKVYGAEVMPKWGETPSPVLKPSPALNNAPNLALAFRAKFIVTEITKTSAGVTRLTLAATHDTLSAPGSQVTADVPGARSIPSMKNANPKGTVTLEVTEAYGNAVPLGAAFYLMAAN